MQHLEMLTMIEGQATTMATLFAHAFLQRSAWHPSTPAVKMDGIWNQETNQSSLLTVEQTFQFKLVNSEPNILTYAVLCSFKGYSKDGTLHETLVSNGILLFALRQKMPKA